MNVKIENTKAQMRKGILDFCILLVLSKKDAYPSDIIHEMKNADINVPEGTLYPLLMRLKNDEFLSYRWEESTMGPPRKYYQITEKGREFLGDLTVSWKELSQSIQKLEELNKH
jgi:PadR family transcriptional regulator PadR